MNSRGQYGALSSHLAVGEDAREPRGHTLVGIKLFHTPSDSDTAVRQIDTELSAILDAMYRAMGVDPSVRKPSWSTDQLNRAIAREGHLPREQRKDPIWKQADDWKDQALASKAIASKSPLWPFFESAVSPIHDEWQQFRFSDQFMTWFTSWEEYEKWLERAKQLRAAVEAKGVNIETPKPVDLTKTLGAEAAGGLKDIGKEALSIMKWAAIGVLAIGGVVALTSAVSHLRKGTDPVQSYTALARRSR